MLAVEALGVQGGQQFLFERVGGLGEDAGQVGQFVQELGVVDDGGVVEGGELGLGAGALVVEFGVAGADAGPVGGGGRALVCGELLEFGDEAGLGGVDAGDFGA
ncbi:MAG TPA: hypothetical protein VKU86_00310 [Acidimicrobiales bacterium]|nr:hypothetical protein [Acidimicrobiales bacterium]